MDRRRFLTGAVSMGAFAAACAPTVQEAFSIGPDFAGAAFAEDAFVSFDGARLGLTKWLPTEGEPWAVVVGLHGMNDYANTYAMAGPYWAERGIATYAYDARGFGRSPNRGHWGGEELMTEDLRTACRVARAAHPDAVLAVVGESMGGATAIATFGAPGAPTIDRLVLAAPAVWGWSELPDMYALTLWLGAHTLPGRAVTPPRNVTRRIQASDNIEMLRALGRDRNMIFETRVDALYGLVNLMETAAERVSAIQTPTAYLYGAHDQIIPRRAAERAARALPAGARTALYPNGWHMLLRDLQAQVVFEDIEAFLRDARAPFPSESPPFVQYQANN
ncbi:MAG: alpha/beta fold hydrolase [Hyphomonadaceae bacterium]